jgi:hypothetical protein
MRAKYFRYHFPACMPTPNDARSLVLCAALSRFYYLFMDSLTRMAAIIYFWHNNCTRARLLAGAPPGHHFAYLFPISRPALKIHIHIHFAWARALNCLYPAVLKMHAPRELSAHARPSRNLCILGGIGRVWDAIMAFRYGQIEPFYTPGSAGEQRARADKKALCE